MALPEFSGELTFFIERSIVKFSIPHIAGKLSLITNSRLRPKETV